MGNIHPAHGNQHDGPHKGHPGPVQGKAGKPPQNHAEIDNGEDEYGQSVHGKGVEVLRGTRGRKHAEHGAHFAEQQKKNVLSFQNLLFFKT
jgi:hypothetical protein